MHLYTSDVNRHLIVVPEGRDILTYLFPAWCVSHWWLLMVCLRSPEQTTANIIVTWISFSAHLALHASLVPGCTYACGGVTEVFRDCFFAVVALFWQPILNVLVLPAHPLCVNVSSTRCVYHTNTHTQTKEKLSRLLLSDRIISD